MRRTSACLAVIAVVISLSVAAPGAASATSLGGTGIGYLEAQSDGVVFATGSAQSYGGVSHPHAPIVGIAAQPGGKGYVLAGADGGVFTFGSAKFYGSMGGTSLTKRVVGVAYTPTGNGYYLVAADGGIFTFGDAVFRGSTGAMRLRAPIVGMAVTPTGKGYWLVAADGGIFTFGDAVFRGSTGGERLGAPVVAMTPTRDGRGYWLAGRDGAVYPFGSAPFLGAALTPIQIQPPVTAIATSASGAGYLLMGRFGEVASFGDAPHCSIYPRGGRVILSGSESVKTIGIAIPFDPAALDTFLAGSCGRTSSVFHPTVPWHIDITRSSHGSGFCEPILIRGYATRPPSDLLLDLVDAEVPGRLEVRSTQMAGATSVRIAGGACMAIARPGTGGTQSLPFSNLAGGDSLPFSSAVPITIGTPRTKAWCRVKVLRDADGSIVYNHNGPQSHVVVPAGTYYIRSEPLCPVHVA